MKFLIKDISSSKTEIRLTLNPIEVDGIFNYLTGTIDGAYDNNTINQKYVPVDFQNKFRYTSTGPHPAIIRLLVAYLKDKLSVINTNDGYVLTVMVADSNPNRPMVTYSHIPIVNIEVEDINLKTLNSQTTPSLLIKLANPLPDSVQPLSEVGVEKQVLTTQEQDFYYITTQPDVPDFRGLDYDLGAIDRIENGDVKKHDFENYNQLSGSVFQSTDETIISEILSSSYDNMRVDYSDFSNHIHFGSALSKVQNFRKKVNEVRKETGIKSDEVEPELTNEQILFREYYGETSDFMLKLEKTDPRTRKLLLQKSLGDLLLDEPVDVGPIVNADPVLRTTENSIPTVERNNQPRLKSDEVELNTAEQNVARRNETETDAEIETLNTQLETIKNNQKDANYKFQRGEQDSELKTATEELDELNTKKKELDEAVADFINCRNGR